MITWVSLRAMRKTSLTSNLVYCDLKAQLTPDVIIEQMIEQVFRETVRLREAA